MNLTYLQGHERDELKNSNTSIIKEFDNVVSFHAEVPAQIQCAMNKFIERYPNWDQYRLIQAALAGFLVQNGVNSRQITRLYVGNMFALNSLNQMCRE